MILVVALFAVMIASNWHRIRKGGDPLLVFFVALVVAGGAIYAGSVVFKARSIGYRPNCANHLKQIGLGFKMYANGHDNWLPMIGYAQTATPFLPQMMSTGASDGLYPAYFNDPRILFCPNNPKFAQIAWSTTLEVAGAGDYRYWGHRIEDEETMLAFVGAVLRHRKTGDVFLPERYVDGVIETPFGRFERLSFAGLSEKEQAAIPIMIEIPGHHRNGDAVGVNILYLDGHVEFHPYPGEFPLTKAVVAALEAFDHKED